MKKGLLLAGAIFGATAVLNTANAVTIRVDDEQRLDFGFRGIIDAAVLGKVNDNDVTDLRFLHRNARIYANYRFNKFLSARFETEFVGNNAGPEVIESYINLSLAPELNVMAGSYSVPFERHSGLQSGWAALFPTGEVYNRGLNQLRHVFTNPVNDRMPRSSSKSAGLTVWGNVAEGMFKYYAGVFDLTDEQKVAGQPKTAFAARVQFTPTMLGYKAEGSYSIKNTYEGKRDVLTVGLSYVNQDFRDRKTQQSWGVDLMWEQKFGTLVPNFQVGYVKHDNWRGDRKDDRTGWLVAGQLLYDQKVWIGKPAFVVRYARSDFKKEAFGTEGKPTVTTWGVGVNYFIKGPENRFALAVDVVDPDKDAQRVERSKGSWTDVTLAIYYNF